MRLATVDARGGPTRKRTQPLVIGRYVLCDVIGGGGMANVHVGRVLGAAGFTRLVAIKRLRPAGVSDVEFATMLVDEARVVSRIRHPNVVPTLDVVAMGRELLLVMEYVHGLPIAQIAEIANERKERVPLRIATRILLDVLAGLEAAHVATDERGRPLKIVHRDVSPQNVLVGTDGVSRLVDFGIAKAEGQLSISKTGQLKGKLRYMAPEQLRNDGVDLRTDLYAAGILLWELITGQRLFERRPEDLVRIVENAASEHVAPASTHAEGIPPALDALVLRALQPDQADRFASAEAMAAALESASAAASAKEVAAYVSERGKEPLAVRTEIVTRVEQDSSSADMAAARPVGPSEDAAAAPPSYDQNIPTGSLDLRRPTTPARPAPSRSSVPEIIAPPLPVEPVERSGTANTATRGIRPELWGLAVLVVVLVGTIAIALHVLK